MQQFIRKRLTLLEVVGIIAVLFVAFTLFLPPIRNPPRPKAMQMNCAGNLKQIGLCLSMYSGDFDGYYPQARPNLPPHSNFEPLQRLNYIQNRWVWACPSRANVMTLASDSAYRYIGSGLKDDNAQATQVSLSYDETENHPDNNWVNVLFIDGHVEGAAPGTTPWAYND